MTFRGFHLAFLNSPWCSSTGTHLSYLFQQGWRCFPPLTFSLEALPWHSNLVWCVLAPCCSQPTP